MLFPFRHVLGNEWLQVEHRMSNAAVGVLRKETMLLTFVLLGGLEIAATPFVENAASAALLTDDICLGSDTCSKALFQALANRVVLEAPTVGTKETNDALLRGGPRSMIGTRESEGARADSSSRWSAGSDNSYVYDGGNLYGDIRPSVKGVMRSFNIVDFGAVPGGKVVCTVAMRQAVQHAAAWASASGGYCEVLVPRGSFLIGSFSLASSVYLRLSVGAVLLASDRIADYPEEVWNWEPALVDTENASRTGIVGEGEINGQALPLWVKSFDVCGGYVPKTWKGQYGCPGECRPQMVRFTDCDHVWLEGVTVSNSPDWTSLFRRCSNVMLHSVTLSGDVQWPNNDGIDIESCSNVSLVNVTIRTGDDGVCISSGNTNVMRKPWAPLPFAPVANLSIRDSRIRSSSSAIKFSAISEPGTGNQQHNSMYNFAFENIEIRNSSRGIGFMQRTGPGNISHIRFENVTIHTRYPCGDYWGEGEPIWMTSVSESSEPDYALTGTIKDILFKNVTTISENGVLLSGRAVLPMDNIVFESVSVNIGSWSGRSCTNGKPGTPTGCRDYRPLIPFNTSVVYDDTSAIYLEGHGSVTFLNTSVNFRGQEPYWVPPLCGGDCTLACSSNWVVTSGGLSDFRCTPRAERCAFSSLAWIFKRLIRAAAAMFPCFQF